MVKFITSPVTLCLIWLITSRLYRHTNSDNDDSIAFDTSFGAEKSLKVSSNASEVDISQESVVKYDENGYVMYCPCMGELSRTEGMGLQ